MRKIIMGLIFVALSSLTLANPKKPGGSGGGDTGTPIVVGQNLGVLPGDAYSDALDVNARGHAVGRSYNGASKKNPTILKAFYWDGTMHQLFPNTEGYDVSATAISDDSSGMEIAVGYESKPNELAGQNPVIWQNPGSSNPTALQLSCVGDGSAKGINHIGTFAVGDCYGGADAVGAIWSSESSWSGKPIIIKVPGDFEKDGVEFPDGKIHLDLSYEGVATGVNDEGIVIGQLTTIDSANETSFLRTYVYFPDGSFEVLPTPDGYAQTSAHAVSNIDDKGNFYVAGSARVGAAFTGPSQAIRWTINTDGTTQSYVLTGLAGASGVSDDGRLVAGTNNNTNQRGNTTQQTAMLYSNGAYIPLQAPSGGSDSAAFSMSITFLENSNQYVYAVGSANSGTYTAALWKVLIP